MEGKIYFNKTLFWDVDLNKLDFKNSADFIIERVLNYGDNKDFIYLKKIYGLPRIKKVAKETNYINKKNINFWSIILNIPQDLFKCKKKFSTKKQNIFLTR